MRRPAWIMIALLLVLAAGGPARGQGASPVLPGPITSEELSGYAKRLGLSDQQRLAIEGFHGTYRTGYADLETTDIEPFLAEVGAVRFGLRMMFHREDVEYAIRRMDRLESRIAAMDERLFGDIRSVLTEEQAEAVDGVREQRERRRLRTGPGAFAAMVNPASLLDVGDDVRDLELDPGVRGDVDARAAAYERDLTAALRRLRQRTRRLLDEMFERAEATGLDGIDRDDRAARSRAIREFRTIWSDTAGALAAEAARISALNRRAVRSLRLMLPDEPGFDLHAAYYGRAYRDLADWDRPVRERYGAMLDRLDTDHEHRAGVEALARAWRARAVQLTGDVADVYDALRLVTGSPTAAVMTERQELQRRLAEERGRRDEAATAALAALDALLAGDPTALAGADGSGDPGMETDTDGNATRPAGAIPTMPENATAPTLGLPEAFSLRDLEDAVRLLALDDTGRTIAATMHDDYLVDFAALETMEPFTGLRRLQSELRAPGSDGAAPPTPAPGEIAKVYELHRAAVAAVGQVDSRFFENLDALADPDDTIAMERIRLARQRDVHRRLGATGVASRVADGIAPYLRDGTEAESRVDVSALVRELAPQPVDPESLTTLLFDHERRTTDEVRRAAETRLALHEALETLHARQAADAAAPNGERRRVGPYGTRYHELMTGPVRSYREHRVALVRENRAVLARLAEVLAEEDARHLEALYAREAFPYIFKDAGALGPMLAAALDLPDLGGSQRLAIEDLAAEYGAAREAFARRFADVELSAVPGGWTAEGRTARAERHRRLERIRRERDDLNHRTRLQMRALLRPPQAARIGLDADDPGP